MARKFGNRTDFIGGLFFLMLGIVVVMYSFKLKIGSLVEPKSGFFPFLGGVAVTALSVSLIIRNYIKPRAISEDSGRILPPVLFMAAMVVFVAVLEWAGFVLATIFLGSVILWILGIKSWRAPVISAVFSIVTYVLFSYILGVELPLGILKLVS
jgi:putative tricarboxylic transport membrane protein